MIPGLVVLYALLICLAAGGTIWSLRLRRRDGPPFLKTYRLFILAWFAYAVMNFVGEVFAPAFIGGPRSSLVRAYMVIDLVTIPLLGGIFFLLYSWIIRLLERRVPAVLKAAFGAGEGLFLLSFAVALVSFSSRGVSAVSYAAVITLNGIVGIMSVGAVLVLLFVPPAGREAHRTRLARGLGTAYAFSAAVLFGVLLAPLESMIPKREIAAVIPAGLVFLFNFPALLYLRQSLKTWPAGQAQDSGEDRGWAALARSAGISEREAEIVRLVALGLGNREIARKLFLSPKTIKNHITSIYAKTGVRNRVQLANLFRRA